VMGILTLTGELASRLAGVEIHAPRAADAAGRAR
jgi:hypothetical protein